MGGIWIVFWLGLSLLLKLGCWQLSRMEEKKAIERDWAAAERSASVPLLTSLSDRALAVGSTTGSMSVFEIQSGSFWPFV